jgi:hypothetical protein
MSLLEILMGFLAGMILIFAATMIFKMRMRTEARLILNSLLGIAAVLLMSAFRVVYIPLNLFNAFLTGFLGVPGVILICLILYL